MKDQDGKDTRYLMILALIFVLLAAGIIIAGYRYYANYAANYGSQIEKQLSAIAELKTGDLAHWRQERMGDAALFYKNPLFSAMVQRYFENAGDVEAEGQLRTWLGRLQDSLHYERVMLLDTGYAKKMVVPEGPERDISSVSAGTSAILQSGRVAFEDFYQDEVIQKIYLKVMVPITAPADGSRIIGFLALRIDPADYLYPMLQRWPAPSATAETLIVRKDGDDVLFLNELKFQQDTALKLRFPLDKVELPSVRGALGYEGITEGRDYRGEQVIAAVRGVPDSPWILIARMDTAEVYAPLTQMRWVMMVLIGALLAGAGAGVGLVWRRRSQLFYRQRAEVAEALRESEERYREFFTASRDSVFISSPDGRLIDFNDATLEMFGYDNREEFSGLSIITLYAHPEDRSVFIDLILRNGHVKEFPVRLKRRGGTIIDALMTAVAQRRPDGTVKALVGTARDITERKKLEGELQKLASVVRYSSEMVNLAMPDGNMTFLNDAGARMLGIDPQNIDQFNIMQFIPDHLKEKVQSELLPALLNGGTWEGDLQYQNLKSGLITDVHALTFVIKDPSTGVTLYLANVSLDITERKQAEDKLKVAFEELRSSNAELERFTYTISHDLKSPLVTIKTFLGYLKQDMPGADAAKVEKDMFFMEGAADKMSRLLDELLEMSRIGRVVNPPVTVALGELAQEALDLVAGGIRERGVVVQVSAEPLSLYGDRPRLVEIWQNLLENAVKFMGGQASPRIDIGFEQGARDTVFFVRDNGMGIDPRYKSRVFNLFDKLDVKAEGTGLGLAIVRRIVELYKGTAWFESAGEGQGSCFFFTLPAALENESKGE